jgi:hypothetical protein
LEKLGKLLNDLEKILKNLCKKSILEKNLKQPWKNPENLGKIKKTLRKP